MKIISEFRASECQNYPALYWLTESCVLKPGKIFFMPDWESGIELHPMLALQICRVGKGFPARFARRYVSGAALWLQAVGLDSLRACREGGLPLGSALCFDGSLISTPFSPFSLEQAASAAARVSQGDTTHSYACVGIEHAERLIEAVAERNTLRMGDVLLVSLPGEPITPQPCLRLTLALEGAPETSLLIK